MSRTAVAAAVAAVGGAEAVRRGFSIVIGYSTPRFAPGIVKRVKMGGIITFWPFISLINTS